MTVIKRYNGATWDELPASGGLFNGSIDWGSPISVTAAGNLTIGKHHIVTITAADATLNLPAVSGNSGQFISVEIASTTTKLITLDGNASETIDGATTRVMWASETCILRCDGSGWTKVAGKSIPMYSYTTVTENKTLAAYTEWTPAYVTESENNISLLSSNKFQIKRTGNVMVRGRTNHNVATADQVQCYIYRDSTQLVGILCSPSSAGYSSMTTIATNIPVTAGQTIYVNALSTLLNPQSMISEMSIVEIIKW